jgi:hypothetical protein
VSGAAAERARVARQGLLGVLAVMLLIAVAVLAADALTRL